MRDTIWHNLIFFFSSPVLVGTTYNMLTCVTKPVLNLNRCRRKIVIIFQYTLINWPAECCAFVILYYIGAGIFACCEYNGEFPECVPKRPLFNVLSASGIRHQGPQHLFSRAPNTSQLVLYEVVIILLILWFDVPTPIWTHITLGKCID